MVLASGTAAYADPNADASGLPIPVPAAQKPTTVCQVGSGGTGAVFVTGLAATKSGYIAVDEQNPDWGMFVLHFNSSCVRTSKQSYAGQARDPEDVAIDKSGTIWVADSGKPDGQTRTTVALWKVPAGGGAISIYRFSYPDGSHAAKALVLDGDGRPIFVTQPASGSGSAGLYEPAAGALHAGSTVALTKVGTFQPESTGTANKLSVSGNLLVTGGANSPDGTKVVLRTYSDAYEWTVTGGDVVKAITGTKPTITPMPNEPQGEAISFTSDGKDFVTISNVNTATPILKYAPASAVAAKKAAKATTPKKASGLHSFIESLIPNSLGQLQLILGLIALLGVGLIVAGIAGIRRSKRRQREDAAAGRSGGPRPDGGRTGPGGDPGGVYGAAASAPASGGPGGVYGGSGRGGAGGGNVYGGRGSGQPGAGNVYGGAGGGAGGGVYGSPGGGQPDDGQPGGGRSGGGHPGSGHPGGGQQSGGVYGAPRSNPRDPYDDRGASGRYGSDPYADPYAAPAAPRPPKPASGGPSGSGGQYSGGQYSGGQYSGGDQYSGGQYSGGSYGSPADPYANPPEEPRRAPGYPDEYGEYKS